MAFDPIPTRTPTSIGTVYITLVDDVIAGKSGEFRFTYLDQDDEVMGERGGDLLPHLSPEQIQQISAFLDWCRAQAEATLPEV